MHFYPYQSFTIPKQDNGLVDRSALKDFWSYIDDTIGDEISEATGCYIFSIWAGKGVRPWYVGKAEKQSFRKECFALHKINHYNNAIVDRRGTPALTLIPKYTPGGRLVRPSGVLHRDIQQLETMLIANALSRNPDLLNVKDTKLLKEMTLPGLINSPKGKPAKSVVEFKKLLGL